MLKTSPDLLFDYLFSLTAVDWKDHFMMVYHLTSTTYRHTIVVKTRIDDRENPAVDTVSDIWKTAEFHEREVFDLFRYPVPESSRPAEDCSWKMIMGFRCGKILLMNPE